MQFKVHQDENICVDIFVSCYHVIIVWLLQCYYVAASDVSTLDDLDELEVYGSDCQQQTGGRITQYTFEVCLGSNKLHQPVATIFTFPG